MSEMETKQIISWLLDKAARAQDHSYARMLNLTAKRLKELDQEQKWIPVTERLPERGADIIVCSHRMIKPVVFTTYFWDEKHDNWLGITHWMPLPEPPKEVDHESES